MNQERNFPMVGGDEADYLRKHCKTTGTKSIIILVNIH